MRSLLQEVGDEAEEEEMDASEDVEESEVEEENEADADEAEEEVTAEEEAAAEEEETAGNGAGDFEEAEAEAEAEEETEEARRRRALTEVDDEWKESFKTELATFLGIAPWRVVIDYVRGGSIQVGVSIIDTDSMGAEHGCPTRVEGPARRASSALAISSVGVARSTIGPSWRTRGRAQYAAHF